MLNDDVREAIPWNPPRVRTGVADVKESDPWSKSPTPVKFSPVTPIYLNRIVLRLVTSANIFCIKGH